MSPPEYAALRERHGPQDVMAGRLGISYRTLQYIEAGRTGDIVPLRHELALRGYVASLAFLPPAAMRAA